MKIFSVNNIKIPIVFYALIIVFIGCNEPYSKDQVCFNKKCINIEIVKERAERIRGLQFRESMPEDSGMLFIFPESRRHGFWMKDTLIPLDIIWLDHGQRIVYIEHNVLPCPPHTSCPSYTPTKSALYVLEVNAGIAEELGFKEGIRLDFNRGQRPIM